MGGSIRNEAAVRQPVFDIIEETTKKGKGGKGYKIVCNER